jgi:hypothetical protein
MRRRRRRRRKEEKEKEPGRNQTTPPSGVGNTMKLHKDKEPTQYNRAHHNYARHALARVSILCFVFSTYSDATVVCLGVGSRTICFTRTQVRLYVCASLGRQYGAIISVIGCIVLLSNSALLKKPSFSKSRSSGVSYS